MKAKIYTAIVALLFINCSINKQAQLPYQAGSYIDDFHYVKGQGNYSSTSFNNWYYAMYGGSAPMDGYVSFSFNDTSAGGNYSTKLTVKQSLLEPVTYQDAEMFNNACVPGKISQNSQPSCDLPFPYQRLQNSQPPYFLNNSVADTGALFNSLRVNLGLVNSPYYPSTNVAYKMKMRIKAEGPTYGTRGWGFWNTQFDNNPPANQSPDYFAWFYEWGVNINFSNSDTSIPLIFPTVITLNDDSVCVSVLLLNAYEWHDYEIVWSSSDVEYYVDSNLVAIHNNPPSADSLHGMALHNWVDNRLFCNTCGESVYARLPIDKSNYIDYFKVEPVFNFHRNKSKPYSLLTVSLPLSSLQKESLSAKGTPNKRGMVIENIIARLLDGYKTEIIRSIKPSKTTENNP